MDDFLLAEPLIIERLKDQIPELLIVESIPDSSAETLDNHSPVTPAVNVNYAGYEIGEDSSDGKEKEHTITQYYLVLIKIRHSGGTEAIKREAGTIIMKVLNALRGYQISKDFELLRWENGSNTAPIFNDDFGWFPLYFSTRLTL